MAIFFLVTLFATNQELQKLLFTYFKQRTVICSNTNCFLFVPFPASVSFIIVFSLKFLNSWWNIKFNDDWIQITDIWCWKRPGYKNSLTSKMFFMRRISSWSCHSSYAEMKHFKTSHVTNKRQSECFICLWQSMYWSQCQKNLQ